MATETSVQDLQRWFAERDCAALVAAYARATDLGDGAAAAALFTSDGELHMPGGRTYVGRDAIGRRIDEQPPQQVSRHLLSNQRVEIRSPDHAAGTSCVTIYRANRDGGAGALPLDGPYLVGDYEDEYRRTAEGWRIARRRLTTIFRRSDG